MSGAIGDTPTKGGGARFKGMKTLSKGAHGMVQLAADQTSDNRCVVIKYVLRGEAVSSRPFLREVLNHQEISMYKHPHFVEFYELFLTPRYLGIVMEYVDGRNLEAYLLEHGGKLPEDAARFLFQQLMVAVEFLHKRRKINLDIKLSSVLITEQGPLPVLKLFHFGLSKDMINDTAPDTRTGTALFSAPEVFLHADGQSYDGVPVDIWSCGVILHIMLFGCHPFLYPSDLELNQGEQVVKLIENVLGGRLQLPDEAVGTPLGNLLRRMLDPEPKQRATIAEIFQDAWFQVNLPPGALELNKCFPESVNMQDAKQSASSIRHMVEMACQVQSALTSAGSSGLAPARSVSNSSSGQMGSPGIQQQMHQQSSIVNRLQETAVTLQTLREQQRQQQLRAQLQLQQMQQQQQQRQQWTLWLLQQLELEQQQQQHMGGGLSLEQQLLLQQEILQHGDNSPWLQQLWMQRMQQQQQSGVQQEQQQLGMWLQQEFVRHQQQAMAEQQRQQQLQMHRMQQQQQIMHQMQHQQQQQQQQQPVIVLNNNKFNSNNTNSNSNNNMQMDRMPPPPDSSSLDWSGFLQQLMRDSSDTSADKAVLGNSNQH